MEENSEVPMETDVSSTTEEALEAENVTGILGNLETTICVETVSEESPNSKSIELFVDTKPVESSKEVPLSPLSQVNYDQGLKASSENNLLSQKSAVSPSKDLLVNIDESKSPCMHDQVKTYNNKHKSSAKLEQLQNTLNCKERSQLQTAPQPAQLHTESNNTEKYQLKADDNQQTSTVKNSSPLKGDGYQNKSSTKDETPLKIIQPQKILNETLKTPSKINDSQNVSNEKNKSPSKTDQPQISKEKLRSPSKDNQAQKILNDKSPLKTKQPEKISIDKEKSPSKNNLSQTTNTVIQNSLPKLNQKSNITKDTNECTNIVLDSHSENLVKEPPDASIEVLSNISPNTKLLADQTKNPLNESADTTVNNKTDGREDEMPESNPLIENCEKDDSQSDINSDIEKDQNKNISRELKSLIKSARESKIISECNQVTSKTRKSRSALDTSLNLTESDKIHEVRRSSINSQKSNCSEKSEKAPKRSMRSQNPEFVNKVKQFLNSVTGKFQKVESDDEMEVKKETQAETVFSPSKKKKHIVPMNVDSSENTNKLRSDPYCWRCHWAVEQVANEKGHPPMHCTVCPRSIHFKCLNSNERNKIDAEKSWVCPECLGVLHAESSETRSPAMKKVSLGHLCELLHYALERMKNINGVEPFLQPVDRTAFPDYDKYVVHPMDLSLMKENITNGLYGSTEAFLADAQWILHNSIIFNTLQSRLVGGARALLRSCRLELLELEACPECYAAAHARSATWFTDVCSKPHMLLWAKLKGFPYWPAKGMSVSSTGMVDVRFFGAHDRAWVPARDCFLICEKDPNNFRSKRQDILDSMQEAKQHIRNISRKYGQFVYAPFKTQLDPTKLTEQLKMMIPTYDGEVAAPVNKATNSSPSVSKGKSRSNSKSSKSSVNDGDVSESDDVQVSRKMADGAEIARDEDFSVDKSKSMEVVENVEKNSRKRRHSDLEEAVITIMDNSSKEKRRKIESDNVDIKKDNKKKVTDGKENISVTEEVNKMVVNEKNEEVLSSTEKVIPSSSKLENEPTVATPGKGTPKVKPIRISISKENAKTMPIIVKPDKTNIEKDKIGDKHKSEKRRNSRNKSINNQNGKIDKPEKKTEKDNIVNVLIKDKNKDVSLCKNKAVEGDKLELKCTKTTDSPKQSKDGLNIDDNTTLAVIAREGSKSNVTGLPTISCVRSLSTSAQSSDTTTKTTTSSKIVEVTVTASSNSSIFIPTSTDNIRNMTEVSNKLQTLRNEKDPSLVGKVGVRAFARMTSPERQITKSTENDNEVDIKTEPMDFDDADRQVEKMDLMKQFSLRPVNPQNTINSLREVRINKVVVAPITRKTVSKPPEVKVKAKKTFPQPRKVDDGRSELNSKNSMVYIPIQPPSTQAPVRPTRPITINGTANTQTVRPQAATTTSVANNIVNTVTTPLVPVSINSNIQPSFAVVTSSTNNAVCVPTVSQTPIVGQVSQLGQTSTLGSISNVGQTSNLGQVTTVTSVSTVGQLPTIGQMNAIGQVPTNVHTVPLITSVNGQWTFSLQPIMSVGGLDETSPLINGLTDRSTAIAPIVSLPAVQPVQVPALNSICNTNPDNPGEPPRLQQKPLLNPLDPSVPIGSLPPPSTAGPLTAKLNQNAVKLTDFFRTLLEDTLDKVDEPAAQATLLKMQVEHTQWRHVQEIRELKHNHELTMMEMRASYEKEKARAVSEARRTAQVELEAAVKATKAKQWCANCSQEAQFYCCWNTSYCDYPCQKAHWNTHYAHCTQQRTPNNGENGTSIEKRLQPAPDNLPKSTPAPTLTVGSRLTPTRVFSQENPPQKTSIIVSMVEDHSGNQTMKCVGTYKPPGSSQVSPLIINKQIINNDESSKKVTSGGYLIVGAGSTPLVTPPRRTHTIQYYT